jgi:cell division protein FtsW
MKNITQKLQGDLIVWMVAGLLALVSIISVYSAIAALAYHKFGGNTERFLFKHVLLLGIGFCIMYWTHKLPYTVFARLAKFIFWTSMLGLVLTFLFGVSLNDAKRWIQIPGVGLSFQTSDFAKVGALLLLCRNLVKHADNLPTVQAFWQQVFFPVFLAAALILPANFSTAALLFINALLLCWIAGVRWLYLLKTVVYTALSAFVLIASLSFMNIKAFKRLSTWQNRVENFVNKENTQQNYQIQEAKTAIWHGGFFGQGPGKGHTRYTLPHPYSDMIYAFIIEEYGTATGLFILLLYLILFSRAYQIAQKAEKNFGKLLAIGIGLSIALQAFINIAVSVGIFPTTGQPLPLVSMGGTSSWFTCFLFGVLLSISKGLAKNHE